MHEAVRAVIIADDLTGACDTGVQFATPALPSVVFIATDEMSRQSTRLGSILESDQTVVVDTESRHESAATAADRVRGLADACARSSVDLIYKKIDSTLRGNVLSELGALQDAFPDRITLLAPAYPAAGRTVVDGRCLVKGVPVDETEFGRDRRSPVTSAVLADYVRDGVRTVAARSSDLAGVLRRAERGDVVIADASTDDELDAIAAVIAANPRRYIPVGSAGLAGAIRRASSGREAGASVAARAPDASGATGVRSARIEAPTAVLGLVGSVSERSRLQAARLRESVDVLSVTLDPLGISNQASKIATALASGQDVLLTTPMPSDQDADAQSMARSLGRLAREVIDTQPRIGLFMTGGDTALSVMDALGSPTLFVYREMAAGVPVIGIECRRGDRSTQIPAITKAGGFGSDNAMIEAFACLREGI